VVTLVFGQTARPSTPLAPFTPGTLLEGPQGSPPTLSPFTLLVILHRGLMCIPPPPPPSPPPLPPRFTPTRRRTPIYAAAALGLPNDGDRSGDRLVDLPVGMGLQTADVDSHGCE
jgi:hypothetical protein